MTVLFSKQDIAIRCDVEVAFVEQLICLGIVEPDPNHLDMLPPKATVRVRQIVRLKEDLHVTANGAAVIAELLDRIADLEHRLRHMRR